jgi:hypothetical protein
MMSTTTTPDSSQPASEMAVDLFDNWFDPIETAVRARAREFIEELIRGELDTVLARPRYGRSQMSGAEASADVTGHRHGSRTRGMSRPLLNSAGRALPVDDAMRLSGRPQVSAWSYAWRGAQPARL